MNGDNPTDGWVELDASCKEATGFSAVDIALALLADEYDPHGEAPYPESATEALANVLGSSGDGNSRGAAAAIAARLEDLGYVLEHRPDLKYFRVEATRGSAEDCYILSNALRCLRHVITVRVVPREKDESLVWIIAADGSSASLLGAIAAFKGVRSVQLRRSHEKAGGRD